MHVCVRVLLFDLLCSLSSLLSALSPLCSLLFSLLSLLSSLLSLLSSAVLCSLSLVATVQCSEQEVEVGVQSYEGGAGECEERQAAVGAI